jgi:Tfp pilus assembly protein PilN
MRQKAHGIILSDDGSFLLASLEKATSTWGLARTRRFSAYSSFASLMLLQRGVIGASPSNWKPTTTPSSSSAGLPAIAQKEGLLAPQADQVILATYSTRLSNNLIAAVPDDAFLCTLPLALGDPTIRSFVSVYRTELFYKIGIVSDAVLCAVFTMAPSAPRLLESHLGRIERYWANAQPGAAWPNYLYLIGSTEAPKDCGCTVLRPDFNKAGIDTSDLDTLRAAGAALSGFYGGSVPQFCGESPEARFRKVRTAVFAFCAGLVLCGLLLACALPAAAFVATRRLASCKEQYRLVLAKTPELQTLLNRNDSLARAIISAHGATAGQTRWTRMLNDLGTVRPDGLYLDMIGTDGSAASGKAGMAFSGWARSESLVTGFIASLQNSGLYSGVSLSSLERNESLNIFVFRITCSLLLFAGSPAK